MNQHVNISSNATVRNLVIVSVLLVVISLLISGGGLEVFGIKITLEPIGKGLEKILSVFRLVNENGKGSL